MGRKLDRLVTALFFLCAFFVTACSGNSPSDAEEDQVVPNPSEDVSLQASTLTEDDVYFYWNKFEKPLVQNDSELFGVGLAFNYKPTTPFKKDLKNLSQDRFYALLNQYFEEKKTATSQSTQAFAASGKTPSSTGVSILNPFPAPTGDKKQPFAVTTLLDSLRTPSDSKTVSGKTTSDKTTSEKTLSLPTFNLSKNWNTLLPIFTKIFGPKVTRNRPLPMEIGRVETAVDPFRQRVLVAYEQVLVVGTDAHSLIVGQLFQLDGTRDGEAFLISQAPEGHSIDPRFHDIPAFGGLTEPTCSSYKNPTVVFVPGETREADVYQIAYEAHCQGTVQWPRSEQFYSNPSPEHPIFDLSRTVARRGTFSVIQGQALKIVDGHLSSLGSGSDAGMFYQPRLLSRLFAWFLNNEADAGDPALTDQSIWKWSSALSPHLSVNEDGTVLLTYQTNLKFNTCLSPRVDLGTEAQVNRYDKLYTIDARLFKDKRGGPVFSAFRSGLTMDDAHEGDYEPDLCVQYEAAPAIESAYNPVSAANEDEEFATVFSVERGTLDQFTSYTATLEKELRGNVIEIDSETTPVALSELATDPSIRYAIDNRDLSAAPTLADEYKHSDPDIVFDASSDYFVVAYDDGAGVHLALLDDEGTALNPADTAQMTTGINWSDPVAALGSRPRLSGAFEGEVLGESVSKIGLAYQYKSPTEAWWAGQNFVRLSHESVPNVSLEKPAGGDFNLTQDSGLTTNFGPSPTALPWGAYRNRYRTFWTGLPSNVDGDTIYSTIVPEGMPPTAGFRAVYSGITAHAGDASGTVRLNQVSTTTPLALSLDGSDSIDPDRVDAGGSGISSWSWTITGPAGFNQSKTGVLASVNLTAFGTYTVNLLVSDADGMTATISYQLTLVQNLAPTVVAMNLFANEAPLTGTSPVVILGQEVLATVTGADSDSSGGTPEASLRYRWEIKDPSGTVIPYNVVDAGERRVSFTPPAELVYTIKAYAIDAENAESTAPGLKQITVQSLRINTFTSSATTISYTPSSVSGNPAPSAVYGQVVFNWTTNRADSVQLLKKEWQDATALGEGAFTAVPSSDISGVTGALPTNSPTAGVTVKVYKKTSFRLQATGRGINLNSEDKTVDFGSRTVTLTAPATVALNDSTQNAAVALTWTSQNIKQTSLEAFEWSSPTTAPTLTAGAGRSLNPATGYLRLIQSTAFADTITKKTTYRLTGLDPFGATVTNDKVVAFNAPAVTTWSMTETDAIIGGNIHLSWTTTGAQRLDVIATCAGTDKTLSSVTTAASVVSASNVEIALPASAVQEGACTIKLNLSGPGGTVSSDTKPLTIVPVTVTSFSAASTTINLKSSTVTGNPAPSAVYGEATLTWATGHASAVKLFKQEWSSPTVAGPEVQVAQSDLVTASDWPLAVNKTVKVKITRKTTFIVEASGGATVAVRGTPVTVDFTTPTVSLSGPSAVALDPVSQNATVSLSWTTLNIKQTHLKAYAWSTPTTPPNLATDTPRSLDPGTGYLELNRSTALSDTITQKTTYRLEGVNLFGETITSDKVVAFDAPAVTNWTVAEEGSSVVIGNPLTISWNTGGATYMEIIYVNGGVPHVLFSSSDPAVIRSSSNVPVILPVGTVIVGAGTVRIDLTGPGGAVPGATKSFTVIPVQVSSFSSVSGSTIDLKASTVDNIPNPPAPEEVYGEAVLAWATTKADTVQVYKKEWIDDSTPGAEVLVRDADFSQSPLPASTAGITVRVYKKTTFTLKIVGNGVNAESAPVTISFNPYQGSITAPASVAMDPVNQNANLNLTWTTTNIKETHLKAYAWSTPSTAPDLVNDTPRNLDPGTGYLELNRTTNFADTISKKTTYVLIGTDLLGVTHDFTKVVTFNNPSLSTYTINETSQVIGNDIHLNWTTANATKIDIVYIKGTTQIILDTVTTPATIASASSYAVNLPTDTVSTGAVKIRIQLSGPGGFTNSTDKDLTIQPVQVSTFGATQTTINLDPSTTSGNPAPESVYGLATFNWTTSKADTVELYRQEYLDTVTPGPEVLVPVGDLSGALNPNGSVTVKVYKRTIFTLKIVGNGINAQSTPVTIFFTSPAQLHLNGASPINLNEVSGNGAVSLTWDTLNIRQTHLEAFEWADFSTPPTLVTGAGRSLDPGTGYQKLNEPVAKTDTITKKTTYRLSGFNLLNEAITPVDLVVSFANPVFDTAWSLSEEGTSVVMGSDIHVSWQTSNATQLKVTLVGAPDKTLATINNFTDVLSSTNTAVRLDPLLVPTETATLRLDLTGPGGVVSSSTKTITVLPVEVSTFETSSNLIDLKSSTTAGNPAPTDVYGEVNLSWTTTQADSVQIYKREYTNPSTPGAEVLVPAGDLSGPLTDDGSVTVRVYKKTDFIVRIMANGISANSVYETVDFNSYAIVPSAPSAINLDQTNNNGVVPLTWTTTNLKAAHLLAYEWADYNAAPSFLAGTERVLDPSIPSYLELNRTSALNDTIVKRTTYRMTGVDLYGNTTPFVEWTVQFNPPSVDSRSLTESDAVQGGDIHVGWTTTGARRVDVVFIQNASGQTIFSESNFANVKSSASILMQVPSGALVGPAEIRIDATGPGGVVQSITLPINILNGFALNSFASNVGATPINLSAASVAGNPTPADVYGEVYLNWTTTSAQFAKLYRIEYTNATTPGPGPRELVPAIDLPDNLGDDQNGRPLPLNPTAPGVKVRVRRNTTYILEITRGGEDPITSQVVVTFNAPAATLNTQAATIPFSNSTRDGQAGLTWSTQNISEVHLDLHQWTDYQTTPNYGLAPTRTLDPGTGYLELNHASTLNDLIVKKVTYTLHAFDLYGAEIAITNNRKIVEFAAPLVSSFAGNDPDSAIDFKPGFDYGEIIFNWATQNTASVDFYAATVKDGASPFVTDSSGNGSHTVQLSSPTTYHITATNPDGRTVDSSNVAITFNLPSITFAAPETVTPASGDVTLYFNRPAQAAWTATQNVRSMTLSLADANGDIIGGYPFQSFPNLAAVGTSPWPFTIPELTDPPAGGVNYRIRAELENPNGGAPVVVTSGLVTVARRPAPHVDTFSLLPEPIVDLFYDAGTIKGSSTLSWTTTNGDSADPIIKIEQSKNSGAFTDLPGVTFGDLLANDSVAVTMAVDDDPIEYRLTAQNQFGDQVVSGGSAFYSTGDTAQAANAMLSFAMPSVTGFSVTEAETYPDLNVHVSWDTKTATSLDVVLIHPNLTEEIVTTINTFATVDAATSYVVPMPAFTDAGDGWLRLDLHGPAGDSPSTPWPITLKQIPTSGVLSFCADPTEYPADQSTCTAAGTPLTIDLGPGLFNNPTTFKWTIDTASIDEVVRICKGTAPDPNGNCGVGPGDATIAVNNPSASGQIVINVSEETAYWIVTHPTGGSIDVSYESPVSLSFNAPAATSFTSTLTTTNQNLETGLNWSGVTNANQIVISQTAGSGMEYFNGSSWVALPVTFTSSNPSSFPSGSLSIRSPNAGSMQLTITATGPHAGSAVRTQNIVVNDLPSVAPLVTTPSVDLDLYAPTRLFVEWKASESSLDQDMGTGIDADGIQKYAICYDIYKSNSSGGLIVDKDTDRLAGEGAPCPDLTSQFYTNISELDADTVLVTPLTSGSCVAGTQCRTQSGIKYYHGVVTMDPKLNDPGLSNQTYLRYEFKVLTIDNGRNGLLGVKEAASFTRIVTDDSVEAWWQFAEDFTQGVDCPGAPAGYTICDSGRNNHHADPVGGPTWSNGAIVLNPNDERTQWAVVNGTFPEVSEFAIETVADPYRIDASQVQTWILFSVMDYVDPSQVLREGVNMNIIDRFRGRIRRFPSGSYAMGGSVISVGPSYRAVYQCDSFGGQTLAVNGLVENNLACETLSFPADMRNAYIGANHRSSIDPANYAPYSGELDEVLFYNRPLSSAEIVNHAK